MMIGKTVAAMDLISTWQLEKLSEEVKEKKE
jgi:hypothetical protein